VEGLRVGEEWWRSLRRVELRLHTPAFVRTVEIRALRDWVCASSALRHCTLELYHPQTPDHGTALAGLVAHLHATTEEYHVMVTNACEEYETGLGDFGVAQLLYPLAAVGATGGTPLRLRTCALTLANNNIGLVGATYVHDWLVQCSRTHAPVLRQFKVDLSCNQLGNAGCQLLWNGVVPFASTVREVYVDLDQNEIDDVTTTATTSVLLGLVPESLRMLGLGYGNVFAHMQALVSRREGTLLQLEALEVGSDGFMDGSPAASDADRVAVVADALWGSLPSLRALRGCFTDLGLTRVPVAATLSHLQGGLQNLSLDLSMNALNHRRGSGGIRPLVYLTCLTSLVSLELDFGQNPKLFVRTRAQAEAMESLTYLYICIV